MGHFERPTTDTNKIETGDRNKTELAKSVKTAQNRLLSKIKQNGGDFDIAKFVSHYNLYGDKNPDFEYRQQKKIKGEKAREQMPERQIIPGEESFTADMILGVIAKYHDQEGGFPGNLEEQYYRFIHQSLVDGYRALRKEQHKEFEAGDTASDECDFDCIQTFLDETRKHLVELELPDGWNDVLDTFSGELYAGDVEQILQDENKQP